MADIGEPQREWEIEPIEAPAKEPVKAPAPQRVPELVPA